MIENVPEVAFGLVCQVLIFRLDLDEGNGALKGIQRAGVDRLDVREGQSPPDIEIGGSFPGGIGIGFGTAPEVTRKSVLFTLEKRLLRVGLF